MSAIRHCAEAMFLEIFANATSIFVLAFFVLSADHRMCGRRIRVWGERIAVYFLGRAIFSYTQSSSTEHYLGLEGSWVARGLDHGHWGRRMEFRGCLCVFSSPWSKVTYLFVRSNFQLEFYWRSSYSSLLFTMCNFCSFSAN